MCDYLNKHNLFLKICNYYLSIFSLSQNYSQSIFSTVSCRTYPLSTLMWKENPENGTSLIRQLENVGWIEVNGRFQFHSKLYPNVEFGFNKRNLLVTTTWVCNFIVYKISVLQVPYNDTFVHLSVRPPFRLYNRFHTFGGHLKFVLHTWSIWALTLRIQTHCIWFQNAQWNWTIFFKIKKPFV